MHKEGRALSVQEKVLFRGTFALNRSLLSRQIILIFILAYRAIPVVSAKLVLVGYPSSLAVPVASLSQ